MCILSKASYLSEPSVFHNYNLIGLHIKSLKKYILIGCGFIDMVGSIQKRIYPSLHDYKDLPLCRNNQPTVSHRHKVQLTAYEKRLHVFNISKMLRVFILSLLVREWKT